MRRTSFCNILILAFLLAGLLPAQTGGGQKPRLVLLIAVDQFRYDYLTRFRGEYTGGIARLLNNGADFVDANLNHYPTVTAIGHSTMMSGATPGVSGIIGNDWFDRATGKQVTSVSDPNTRLLGGAGQPQAGSSPHRLLVSTVGDEVKRAAAPGTPAPKVIGISMKDRASILPAGHMADAAYWFDEPSGHYVSSTYYFSKLPSWVSDFNSKNPTQQFAGKVWLEASGNQPGRQIPTEPGSDMHTAVYYSPFGNDLLEQFVQRAIEAEQLGQRGVTDVLTVSFSSNDAVGHAYGPDSREVHAVSLSVDRAIGNLFDYLDQTIGMDNVLVIMTSDHGVSPVPEVLESQHMPGGRITGDFFAPIEQALTRRFGNGQWILATAGSSPYLNYELIDQKKLSHAEVEAAAAEAAAKIPQVTRVYTRQQFLSGRAAADPIDARVIRSFYAPRSGDLEILLEPYWIRGAAPGTTHGTPYNYDTHIPLIFMGRGIRPGRYYKPAALNDLAPTVATMLNVEIPSGSVGRILDEMLDTGAR